MSTPAFNSTEILSTDVSLRNFNRRSKEVSVKVTDYSCNNVNPSPIKLPKDSELLEEFLSPRKLQALTGVENLETVEYLEMRVNTEQMSLGNFGIYLPNLTQIKLSGSYIPSIRDLGTALWNLQVLWMPQCTLRCLDGLVTLSSLKELYLAYNEIEDISPCGMLENLEILDLEGNLVEDTSNLHYLSMCNSLSRLTLAGNPLCDPNKYDTPLSYRKCVIDAVPQLDYLDDLRVNQRQQDIASGNKHIANELKIDTSNATLEFESHWNFINKVLIESGLLAESESMKVDNSLTSEDSGRPSSSYISSSTRPCSAKRPLSGQRKGLTTAIARPSTSSQRPDTGSTTDSIEDLENKPDDSNLTAGRVVCGNITKSLRRRNSEQTSYISNLQLVMEGLGRPRTIQTTATSSNESFDENCERVLAELNEWRKEYERSKERIEKSRTVDILTVEFTENQIEEVSIDSTDDSSSKNAVDLTKHYNICDISENHRITSNTKHKTQGEIKLNPLRNTTPNAKQNVLNKVNSTGTVGNSSNLTNSTYQLSKMRKQILQNAPITPSKPLLKKLEIYKN